MRTPIAALFERRELWSILIYKSQGDIQDQLRSAHAARPYQILSETGLRLHRSYRSTMADPCLFSWQGELFLFYEAKDDYTHGEIWVSRMAADGLFGPSQPALIEAFHLSYPQVFVHQDRVFMLPEAAASGKVLLYEAEEFPGRWRRLRTLIERPLRDPNLYFHDDGSCSLLATTADMNLLHFSAASLHDEFTLVETLYSRDLRRGRNAGSLLQTATGLVRPSQDCVEGYGKAVYLNRVTAISATHFSEQPAPAPLRLDHPYASEGCHHVSHCVHRGESFMAIDGRRKDRYVNTLLHLLLKTKAGLHDLLRR